jgi:hypothetical protein
MRAFWNIGLSLGALALAAGCGKAQPASSAAQSQALAVFTTDKGVFSAPLSSNPEAIQKVKAFFPAACADRDDDGDGVPNSMDIDDDGVATPAPPITTPSAALSKAESSDAGESEESGEDQDQNEVETHQPCQRCNRGPGTSGQFRFEVKDAQAELERGRVSQIDGNNLTVPSPLGPLTIVVGSATQIDDGPVTPGAEIRAEGTVQANATNVILATRITVLCPGPTPMPAGQLPPGATPVSGTDLPPTPTPAPTPTPSPAAAVQ